MQRMGAILILDNDCAIVERICEILSDEGYVMKPFEIGVLLWYVAPYVRLPRSGVQRLLTADSSEIAQTLLGGHVLSSRCISPHLAMNGVSVASD